MQKLANEWFKISIDGKSVYVWHSRRFEEMMYMQVPRFLFLAGSIYIIYLINLR